MHTYEVRPRKDHRGVNLVSDALPFGRLWYVEPNAITNAVGYAKFYSRSLDCCDSRLRFDGQCDPNARTLWRLQRAINDRARIVFDCRTTNDQAASHRRFLHMFRLQNAV